jgi:hypothetical protein
VVLVEVGRLDNEVEDRTTSAILEIRICSKLTRGADKVKSVIVIEV